MRRLKVILVVAVSMFVLSPSVIGCSPSNYKLSTSVFPSAAGTVDPAGATYQKGLAVNVSAIPASGYRFDHWEGGASGASPTVLVAMDSNKQLSAYFTKVYGLTASGSPSSGGSVSPSSGTYDAGKQVTLIATPTNYYKFNGWGGDASGNSDHLTVTMDSSKSIVASFVKLTYALRTQADTSGNGTVVPNAGVFEAGTQAKVTATPGKGYRFDHWEGDASGTSNPLNIIVDADKTITAKFVRVYALDTVSTPVGIGTVSPENSSQDAGSKVTLTAATSMFPYAFDHWSGTDSDNSNPTTVTMSSDKSVTAYFRQLNAGPQQAKGDSLSGPAKIATFELKAGQWVQGELSGVRFDLSAQIIDSSNKVSKDLGRSSFNAFQFQAPSAGIYHLFITDIHSILFNRYALTYSIYS